MITGVKTITVLSVMVALAMCAISQNMITPGDFVVTSGGTPSLSVNFAYTFNRLYPTEAAPARIIWYWGDDKSAKDPKSYADYPWAQGQRVHHDYIKTGTYDILIVVNDAKNFNLRQQHIRIKLSKPVQVCPCDP